MDKLTANIPNLVMNMATEDIMLLGTIFSSIQVKGRIYKSTDKGLTWSIAFNGSTYGLADFGGATVSGDMAWRMQIKVLLFKEHTILLPPVQTGLAIYGTTDGGTTWNSISFTGITAKVSMILHMFLGQVYWWQPVLQVDHGKV
jgi:hypothetical protein